MYGVPEDLDLTPFEDTVLDYITLARYTMFLFFDSDRADSRQASLQVEGPWELLGPDGELLDEGHPGFQLLSEHGPLRIHACVGRRVSGVSLNAPSSFTVHFEGGYSIRFSDHPGYEALYIEPGGVRI